MCRATSAIASAASRPATRILATVSASLTSDPVNRAGAGLPTYSGRGIDSGTDRRGEMRPGVSSGMVLESSWG